MAFEDFKNSFSKFQADIEEVVQSAVNQILQKEIVLENQITEQPDLQAALGTVNFPAVALTFQTGDSVNHLVMMEPEFVNQFYAWMIADEPAETVGEEQLEGVKEAFDQIYGQIKISIADDQFNFQVDNVQITPVDGSDGLPITLGPEPTMVLDYNVSADEKSFNLNYYTWPVPGAVFNVQTNGVESLETEVSPEVGPEDLEKVTVQPAEFGNLSGSGAGYGQSRNVEMLMDVNLEITVELDRKVMLVSELLKLGKGSIIELEKSAGEPLDIFINGRKFAEGEVVVIDDKFGIRLTQLLSPRDRIKSLGV